MRSLWMIVLSVVLAVPLPAATIQYRSDNSNITGVSDETIPAVSGYGLVTIAEPVSSIVWPLPTVTYTGSPGACPTGSGQPSWTRITDAGAVTAAGAGLAIQTELVGFFFTSAATSIFPGCHLVFGFAALKTLAVAAITDIIAEHDLVLALNAVNVAVARRCPGVTGGANCDTARANMVTLDARYPTAGAVDGFTTNLVTLDSNLAAFKAAKGW